ncbi:hypothetical protein C8Q79DRAFT_940800 [Trametes meyenii]|nr:hypothetical protein C8Q79DRAFT_940800 [Trametes meyenii]
MNSQYNAGSQAPGTFYQPYTTEDCPLAFRPPLYSWSELPPNVQSLSNTHLLDVSRLICGLSVSSTASSSGLTSSINELAHRIRSMASDMHSRGVFSGSACAVPTTQETSQPSVSQKPTTAKSKRKQEDVPVVRHPPRTRSWSAKANGAAATVKSTEPVEGPKPKKARVVKTPLALAQTIQSAKRSQPTTRSLPIRPRELETLQWSTIYPPGREGSLMASGAPILVPLHSSLKPRIWAASREELCRILPEYARAQDDVLFENCETPTLFVDGGIWPEDKWDGGKTIELSMVREFRRRLPDLPPLDPKRDTVNTHQDSIMGAAERLPRSISPAVVENEDGMYRFVSEAPNHSDSEHPSFIDGSAPRAPSQPACSGSTAALTALAPRDAPPEIQALLDSQSTEIPVSLILCRGAALAPFALPEGCGCAFLGFFFIKDVCVQVDNTSWEVVSDDPPITLVHGRKTWRFQLEWTPGGEDADLTTSPLPTPWWMETAAPSLSSVHQVEPLLLPHTLLPLHFLAPPEQYVCSDADVKAPRGWHCASCGKLNLQQNLCYQKCNRCSASNRLPPIAVEYVRQSRPTNPVALPWDRYPTSVLCTSVEGRHGLSVFSYALSEVAYVHHVFTRNRVASQSESTELFHALQADVELVSELGAKGRSGGGIGPYYGCKFAESPSSRRAVSGGWCPDAPDCVRRARDLMLLRGQVDSASSEVLVNTLAIHAWRTAGHKKGCVFSAERTPVVLMCLGADVEVTFWQRAAAVTRGVQPAQVVSASAPCTVRSSSARATRASAEDSDDEYVDEPGIIPAPTRRYCSSPKSSTGSAKTKRLEEALMVTLVHGDLLVVHGAKFDYSIKRTGMSMVLLGQQ